MQKREKINPTIFIVTDDDQLKNYIVNCLMHLGCEIICLTNGGEVISSIKDFTDILIVLDYKLPDMSVRDVMAEVLLINKNIPFIIMTDYSDIKTVVEMMKSGARDYLIKDYKYIDVFPTVIEQIFKEINIERKLIDTEKALRKSEGRYRTLFDNALVGIISIRKSDRKIISINDFGCKILGYNSKEEIIEKVNAVNIGFLLESPDNMLKELEEKGEITNRETQLKRKDGSIIWCIVSTRLFANGDELEVVVINITKRKEAEERIYNLTYYDQLTKLPNKELFKIHMETEILKAKTRGKMDLFAVMCLGIDKFKYINNAYGTDTGNLILIEVGSRLKKIVFKNDTVSRFESDTFMILFSDIASRDDVGNLIRKIQNVFSDNFLIGNMQLVLSATIGICIYPEDGILSEVLIKNCQAAMDMAKERGVKTHFFDADLNAETINNFQILHDLKDAITNSEFIAYYQPKVTYEGEIVGMEPLIRWQSPVRGLVFPSEFISIAEKNGLIVEIGNIILKKACIQNMKWQDMGLRSIKVAVNLSPYHFNQSSLIGDIRHILKETGLKPEWLELEITESGIIENEKESIAKINELHQMGISVSIDDFGTGYSSLSKLKDYPIDTLKIDRFFVESIPFDKKSMTIAKTIIDLAHNLDFKVVAEGVELKEQLDFLKSYNCDYYQGYYFSKPLPPEAFNDKL